MSSFEFLGPYRIGKPLGRGGMGAVFAAVHEKSGERVAVKLISQHVADDIRFRRRFDAEVKALQRLRHVGIVRLIGFGEESGRLFYSMELVEGESLQKRIRREKKLDWRSTIDIAIQMCSALKHAHDIGVFHRDLKPANLLLTADDTLKIVDFGIAKDYFGEHQTLDGAVLGTADYMAPEQATGSGCTVQTDLYAMGSVMYAMLTGRPPFTGKTITSVIESLRRDRPVPLDLVDPELPIALVELVHELLEKDAKDRPPTTLAVMNRLKAMRAGLQREQTAVIDGLPTRSSSTPVSHDTDIVEENSSSAATGVSGSNRHSDAPGPTVLSDPGASPIAPNDPTLVSGVGQTKFPGEKDDEEPLIPQTHFQTVDETASSKLRSDGSPDTNQWIHVVSLIVLLIAVIGGVWWFVQSTRLPGAEEAYAIIQETGDPQAMDDFLRRFEDHDKYAEIYELRMASRLESTIKRLKTQAKLDVTPLNAFEQGFVDATEFRQQDPKETSRRLQLWLDVHVDSTAQLNPTEQEMVSIATFERDRLADNAPQIVIDPKAQQLIDRIRSIAKDAPAEDSRKMLEAILKLHEEDEWAKPALAEAEKKLRSLQ